MNELFSEFLVESYENLDLYDAGLLELEKKPDSPKTISAIFRTLHTIKGTCGFLGLGRLEAIAHAGENLLSLVRDGALPFTRAIASALLATGDAVRSILAEIEKNGTEGTGDYSALIATLVALQKPESQAAAPTETPPVPAPQPGAEPAKSAEAAPSQSVTPPAREPAKKQVSPASAAPKPAASSSAPAAAPAAKTATVPSSPKGAQSIEGAAPSSAPSSDPSSANPPPGDAADSGGSSKIAESNVRVNVDLLDRLMNLVGELVLTRNQIVQISASVESASMQAACHRLNHITTELQDRMMKTRVQPIDSLWSKLPRTVRDLARMCGKEVRLDTEGAETELDRTVIEAIKDPMTHLLRNSVDHGIESPQERVAAGKNPEGRILLRAFHAAGLVTIEIIDDGGGIKLERVKARALERNLITQEKAALMSNQEVVNLVFLPGFSTAEKVSNISGRGVGMDVVKTQIEKIGGMVDMSSEPGKGTTCRIKIPLTLAIIPALIVGCRGELFAIPQTNLLEVIRLDKNMAVETVHETPVVRLRGSLLPIVFLDSVLELHAGSRQHTQHLVVLQAGDRHFGLVVDTIHEAEEIVVKPLGRALTNLNCFAGATILGDGHVSLILDIYGLGSRASMFQTARTSSAAAESEAELALRKNKDEEEMLVFRVGGTRVALPLDMVSRLEEFPLNRIEQAAGRQLVQYSGTIMPLIPVARALGLEGADGHTHAGSVQTIVYSKEGRSVGLLIDSVEEIVRGHLEIQAAGRRSGILGSAVIGKQITELIDAEGLVQIYAPELLS